MEILFFVIILYCIINIHSQCINDGCYYEYNRTCQCNDACIKYNDCCDDYKIRCLNRPTFMECPYAPNIPNDRRSNKDELKIVSYNAEWLFLDDDRSMGSLECPGECQWNNKSHALRHFNVTARYLSNIDADIIVLIEVSDCWTCQMLIGNMTQSDQYRGYLIKGKDMFTGQNICLITKIDPVSNLTRSNARHKYPITNSKCGYNDEPVSYGVSKHVKATFHIDGFGKNIDIYGIHLLSQPTNPKNCAKREAQAMVLSDMIRDSVNNDHYVIIAGDYNDYDDIIKDRNNNVPTSQVTKIIRESGDLMNVASMIHNQSKRWTSWWNYYNDCSYRMDMDISMIDMIYVSKDIYNKIIHVTIDHSYINGCDNIYSDHYPIIMTLNTKFTELSNDTTTNDIKFNVGVFICGFIVAIIIGICFKMTCLSKKNQYSNTII